jgi:hypothetical protein
MRRRRAICLSLLIVSGLFFSGAVRGEVGEQLWETPLTFPGYDTITVNYAALSATRVILSGNAKNASGAGGQIGFVKAFDVATGAVKWDKTLAVGATGNGCGFIVINGDIALVRGSAFTSSGNPATFSLFKNFIWAYNADNGQQLGEVVRDFESTVTPSPPGGVPLLSANNRAFTYFTPVDSNGVPNVGTIYVRAYLIRNALTASMLLLE